MFFLNTFSRIALPYQAIQFMLALIAETFGVKGDPNIYPIFDPNFDPKIMSALLKTKIKYTPETGHFKFVPNPKNGQVLSIENPKNGHILTHRKKK